MNIIYGVMKIVNFAHGEFMILAAYLTFTMNHYLGINALESIIVIMPLFFFTGILLYRLIGTRL